MYLVDTNVLIYAAVESADGHEVARSWLDGRLPGRMATVGLPWQSLLGFVQTVSSPRFLEPPVPVSQAWQQVEKWLDAPAAWVPVPGRRHRHLLAELIESKGPDNGVVADLHLAALALENGLVIASVDEEFKQLAHVRWVNPLRRRLSRPGAS